MTEAMPTSVAHELHCGLCVSDRQVVKTARCSTMERSKIFYRISLILQSPTKCCIGRMPCASIEMCPPTMTFGTLFFVCETFSMRKDRRHVSPTSASVRAILSDGREHFDICTLCRRYGSATSCQPDTISALLHSNSNK